MDKNSFQEGETEWDLRQSRLKLIGKLLEEKTVIYLKCIRTKDPESLKSYMYILKAIYRNVKGYARENDDHDKTRKDIERSIKQISQSLEDDEEIMTSIPKSERAKIFEELEDVEDKIQGLRMDVGLDIPRKKEYDPENAGVAGLK